MQSDIADGSLRDWEIRKFDFLVGDYYIAPSFLDAVVVSFIQNLRSKVLCSGLWFVCKGFSEQNLMAWSCIPTLNL